MYKVNTRPVPNYKIKAQPNTGKHKERSLDCITVYDAIIKGMTSDVPKHECGCSWVWSNIINQFHIKYASRNCYHYRTSTNSLSREVHVHMPSSKAEIAIGIVYLSFMYYLLTGNWPDVPEEIIDECFDRTEERGES